MKTIEEKIMDVDSAICDYIDLIEVSSRGRMSDAILKHLRDLLEHIAVKIYAENNHAHIDYDSIPLALANLRTSNDFYFIRKFHGFLQESSSHYTHDPDGAERLMLKYYEYLLQVKSFVYQRYSMEILHNIEKFPVDLDDTLQQYYEKIVEKLDVPRFAGDFEKTSERFYVQKCKPFFVNHHVYYENTLIPANDEASKFNRLVVFSRFKIQSNYAIKVGISDDIIEIAGKFMPIKILTAWNVSIRPCELNNFAKVVGEEIVINTKHAEYIGLMNYIAKTGLDLVEILSFSNDEYDRFKSVITERARVSLLSSVFDKARAWVLYNKPGSNVIRYLLYGLNNKIIKLQYSSDENYCMKGLFLDNRSIPFDEMPYASSLYGHNPSFYDVHDCIELDGREHEVLAHRININSNTYGKLYTKENELEGFENIEALVEVYNNKLYEKHQHRRIERIGKNFCIKGHESDTKGIIDNLKLFAEEGIVDYKASVENWITENPSVIDCDEKREILLNMFEKSRVAMIYGAAGTGKSTLIKHVSQFWKDSTKVYIANTHPAVENLRRKVKDESGSYLTIKRFIYSYPKEREIDVLFIDECSMVSNRDMMEILRKGNFKLLVLVGDIYQIESIQFGNWFSLARYFVPKKSQYELVKPYRTSDGNLLELWSRVRNYEDNVEEWLGQCNYTEKLDESIFESASDDEIVLCLNYDGLYGINNINRFLQNANPNRPYTLGVWTYKVGDKILFNESSKYESVLYNNLKGKIVNIEEIEDKMYFSIEIDKVLNGMQVFGTGLELLPMQTSGKSIVRFGVKKKKAGDDDFDEYDLETSVPFQIAYAVSIHKAQGLEYNSVKIVITKEIDELITHNIFYTAITRARASLKIYWTAESQKKILESFVADETLNDATIFAARTGVKMNRERRRGSNDEER